MAGTAEIRHLSAAKTWTRLARSSIIPGAGETPGAVAVGTATYAVPSGSLFVDPANGSDAAAGSQGSPHQTVAHALAAASYGQTIVLRAGTYHEGITVSSSKSVTIQAYPNEAVWFDGSTQITSWTQQGGVWVHSGWTAQFDHSPSYTFGQDDGFVNPSYPMAAWPDQVFIDGVSQEQVAAGTTPTSGQFAVDYNAQTITIGTDPAGHEVRASDLGQAIVAAGPVQLLGFGVRRYATCIPLIGTIYFGGVSAGSLVENLVVDNNATEGIGVGVHNVTINHVTATNNGLMGFQGNSCDGLVISNSIASNNNREHFNTQPSSGGMKIARCTGLTIVNCEVSNNTATSGIWTDISVTQFAIIGNTVQNNPYYGIEVELSQSGIIANNTVSGSRYGITPYNSGSVQIYNNHCSGNSVWDIGLSEDARVNSGNVYVSQSLCSWRLDNLTICNNQLDGGGGFEFYALDKASNTPASAMHITINGNVFGNNTAVMVGWGGGDNTTVTYYRTPSALNTALGVSWSNGLSDGAAPTAVPLPSDVAAAIGVAAGTQHIGTF